MVCPFFAFKLLELTLRLPVHDYFKYACRLFKFLPGQLNEYHYFLFILCAEASTTLRQTL